MPDEHPAASEPPADEPATVDRTAAERLATAAQRAAIGADLEAHEREGPGDADDADHAADAADKTDMNAVGDDGQVFGG